MNQVMYKRNGATNDTIHSGILLDNGDLICGHCGELIDKRDRVSNYSILKIFDDWVSLDESIRD